MTVTKGDGDMKDIVTVRWAALQLNVSEQRVRTLCRQERLRAKQVKGKWMIEREDVEALKYGKTRRRTVGAKDKKAKDHKDIPSLHPDTVERGRRKQSHVRSHVRLIMETMYNLKHGLINMADEDW